MKELIDVLIVNFYIYSSIISIKPTMLQPPSQPQFQVPPYLFTHHHFNHHIFNLPPSPHSPPNLTHHHHSNHHYSSNHHHHHHNSNHTFNHYQEWEMVVLQSLDWDTCDVTSNDFMQPLLRHLPLSLPPSQHHQVIRHAQTFACLAATGGCVWLRVVVCPWLCVLVCLWLCVVVFLGLCVVVYVVFGGCLCGFVWLCL